MTEIEPNRLLAALALTALAPTAASFTPPPPTPRVIAATPAFRDGWFICDAVDAPLAALVGAPEAGKVDITLVSKTRRAQSMTTRYDLGSPEPGAGQVYYSLSSGGREIGNLHQFNPAAYGGLGVVRTPPFTSIKLGDRSLSCRWLAGTRFIGVGSGRSYLVTQGPQGLAYRSFDYGAPLPVIRPDGAEQTSAASFAIDGGTEETSGDGTAILRFERDDNVYAISIPPAGAATLEVTHGGVHVGGETMLGAVFTGQLEAPPRPAVRLTSGGWPRLSETDVWTSYSPFDCLNQANEACLTRQMKDGGATPSALAFTKRLEAAQAPGYVSDWDDDGPVGIATVTYPWRQPAMGLWMIPSVGPPIDTDAYELSAEDKARGDVKAVLRQFPTAYVANGGSTAVAPQPLPGGGQRLLWKSYLTVCDDCQPQGSVTIGYEFDQAGRFMRAGVVEIH